MRLENRFYKWIKFLIKLLPFYFIIFSFVNILFNETLDFDITTILTNSLGTENYFLEAIKRFLDNNAVSFTALNRKLFNVITGSSWNATAFANAWNIFHFTLTCIEWFIIVDLIDLIFSVFKFIIDFCRSWLDGFYDKNKGGY